MRGRTILTAAEMRAAEAQAIDAGTSSETLMERAGTAAAEAIWHFAGPLSTLVLCGPGNNGGDGYVIARLLRERGVDVRVAALGEPKTSAAAAARANWGDTVESLQGASPAPILIDALFGTGLARGLDAEVADTLARLSSSAHVRVAVDLPSGVATDDGSLLSSIPNYDLTITFATLKPSHLLQPAASRMGRLVVADIGVQAESLLHEIGPPRLRKPRSTDHKYDRGYVALVAGAMPGASALAATASVRAGAGYVRVMAPVSLPNVPAAIVQDGDAQGALSDQRIGAVAIGPGLGTSAVSRELLREALALRHPLVLDADALNLIASGAATLASVAQVPILTPHEGEFRRLFGDLAGGKVERARSAAARSGAVILYKGSDTVVADPSGRAAILPNSSHWLATAGTGDVLAGIVAAMRAQGLAPFEAACAGAWLHARAAMLAGPVLIADDLLRHLPQAVSECL